MTDKSSQLTNIRPRGGRPLDTELYDVFSAELDGREFFFHAFSNHQSDYALKIWGIGKPPYFERAAVRVHFNDAQMKIIKDGLRLYFRTHGRGAKDAPPQSVIFDIWSP